MNGSLSDILVGRRIVKADGARDKLVLDDGTELYFEEYGDCCAWGDVERLAEYDHVITSVRVEEDSEKFSASIFVLSEADVESEVAHVVGYEGSGYYSFGIRIKIGDVQVESFDWSGS